MKKIINISIAFIVCFTLLFINFNENNYVNGAGQYDTKVLTSSSIYNYFNYNKPAKYAELSGGSYATMYSNDMICPMTKTVNGTSYNITNITEYTFIYYFGEESSFESYQTPTVMHYTGTVINCKILSTSFTSYEKARALACTISAEFPVGSVEVSQDIENSTTTTNTSGHYIPCTVDAENETSKIYFAELTTLQMYKSVKINRYKTDNNKYIYEFIRTPEAKYQLDLNGDRVVLKAVE